MGMPRISHTGMKLKLSKQMCINVVLPKRAAINPSFMSDLMCLYYRTELKEKIQVHILLT